MPGPRLLLLLLLAPSGAGGLASKARGVGSPCAQGLVPWPRGGAEYECQDAQEAAEEALTFLRDNMPPGDVLNAETLARGIAPVTANLSLAARQQHRWATGVPKDVWQNYVLPYASVNEARSDWRQLLATALAPLVSNATARAASLAEVAQVVNRHLWSALRPGAPPIVFKAQQTPLIYDPMSTIAFGYASCTGISNLYVDALRAVGVPARLAGTPAWHGVKEDGNHNWAEVWLGPGAGLDGGPWSFIEGLPAGGGQTLTNPCDKWFCNPQHFDGKTMTFATQFDRRHNSSIFPMQWDPSNRNVPGVDISAFYNKVCGSCVR